MSAKGIRVKELSNQIEQQIGPSGPRPVLWYRLCESVFSANSGDYRNASPDHVFTHCGVNMKLAIPYRGYKVVR